MNEKNIKTGVLAQYFKIGKDAIKEEHISEMDFLLKKNGEQVFNIILDGYEDSYNEIRNYPERFLLLERKISVGAQREKFIEKIWLSRHYFRTKASIVKTSQFDTKKKVTQEIFNLYFPAKYDRNGRFPFHLSIDRDALLNILEQMKESKNKKELSYALKIGVNIL